MSKNDGAYHPNLPQRWRTRGHFVLLPRRWVVEPSFAWMARFRRLARDYARLPIVLAGLHFIAFACLSLRRVTAARLSQLALHDTAHTRA